MMLDPFDKMKNAKDPTKRDVCTSARLGVAANQFDRTNPSEISGNRPNTFDFPAKVAKMKQDGVFGQAKETKDVEREYLRQT